MSREPQVLRIGVLASGEGTLLQHIIDEASKIPRQFQIATVISNNPDSPALRRASKHSIPQHCINVRLHGSAKLADENILSKLKESDTNLVFLAGYLRPIGPATLGEFRDSILNTHPSLLPKHGGKGMYGINVFRSIMESKDEYSGVTIHMVDPIYDHGATVGQAKFRIDQKSGMNGLITQTKEREKKLVCDVLKSWRSD